ncbi:uncharacterized protein LOC110246517 [Exaiptasia diaphana]|uniref:BEN domain-containing protein n=1 Tax=Exaiptasia diaphana TaxID=2652724 RepID=A0A913YNR8_EXADI|nr:uncharacterized protein LOC110246517 [Exaiptasia diaphana]
MIAAKRKVLPSDKFGETRSSNQKEAAIKFPRKQHCTRCDSLLAEMNELKAANTLLTNQLNQYRSGTTDAEAPRPGKVPKAIAEQHQMIELCPGKRVYVYESHITKAHTKKTATATACFLLSCFYKDAELIGKSLTEKNGKPCLDVDIIESILSFIRKRFNGISNSPVCIALRNKITCLEACALKKQGQ